MNTCCKSLSNNFTIVCHFQEIVVLNIDRHAPFPMRVSVNLLCMSPKETTNQQPIQEPEAEADNVEDRPGPS